MKQLYNTFHRGWYYHRNTDNNRSFYEDHNFQHTSDVVLMSNEIDLLCEDFYNKFLKITDAPPCYLVLVYMDNKWVCFIDFHCESVNQIYNTYTHETMRELRYYNIFHIDIGDYKLDAWESAQRKALELLTNFITTRS